MTHHLRVSEPSPGVLAFYDGRVEGYRFDPSRTGSTTGRSDSASPATRSSTATRRWSTTPASRSSTGGSSARSCAGAAPSAITVVLSHWHLDHVAGTEAFADCRGDRQRAHGGAPAREAGGDRSRDARGAAGDRSARAADPDLRRARDADRRRRSTVELIQANIHSDDATVLWLPDRRLLLCGDTMEDTVTYVDEPDQFDAHLRDLDRLRGPRAGPHPPRPRRPRRIAAGGYPPGLNDATQLLHPPPAADAERARASRGAPARADRRVPRRRRIIYFEPYEAVHRQNVAAVLGGG